MSAAQDDNDPPVIRTTLDLFIEKLDLESELAATLKAQRITNIRKFRHMTSSFIDTNVAPLLTYPTAIIDLEYVKRFIPVHQRRMRSTKVFPSYETMSTIDIDVMISEHEAHE